jgi:N-acetylated-alpha-linked acidic dipeptidase
VAGPPLESPPPHFDFAPLLDAQDSLAAAASRYEKAYERWAERTGAKGSRQAGAGRDAASLHAVNERLTQSERAFLNPDGLEHRPWYKHLLYAPGFYTGYDVKTMPGVREAIEQGKWSGVDREIGRVAEALDREARLIADAAKALDDLK